MHALFIPFLATSVLIGFLSLISAIDKDDSRERCTMLVRGLYAASIFFLLLAIAIK